MFNVVFYEFNKRPNSTKRPTSSTPSATFACSMKAPSSLTAPQIELSLSGSTVPKWNYCYIADIGQRYYYITRTYYDLGIWTFQLSVDVLATYYTDIRNSRQFALRSATVYEPDLIDAMYPTTPGNCRTSAYAGAWQNGSFRAGAVLGRRPNGTTVLISDYFDIPVSNGRFILAVKGNNTTGVTYYSISTGGMNKLIDSSFNIHPSMSSDTTSAFANAVYDPLQYVVSCRWYPYAQQHSSLATNVSKIVLGNEEAPLGDTYTAQQLSSAVFTIKWECFIEIPKHPDADTYRYMNLSPYSNYTLYMQPFGFIPIDSTKLHGRSYLCVKWNVDYLTGICALELSTAIGDVETGFTDSGDIFFASTYEYGVDIPINSLVTDWKTGAIISGLSFIDRLLPDYKFNTSALEPSAPGEGGGGGHSFGTPDVSSVFEPASSGEKGILSTVIDAVGSAMGKVQSVGGVGSFLAYCGQQPIVLNHYVLQNYHDDARFGRPCYQVINMASNDGYVLCQDASVDYTQKQPLPVESSAVAGYLNGGIYME